MNAAIPDKVAPNAAPAAYPLLFDDDVVVDDVEEGSPLKNDDELHELNEEVEDSAAASTFVAEDERRDEDLAAKTPEKRFAALLNMMTEIRCYLNQ